MKFVKFTLFSTFIAEWRKKTRTVLFQVTEEDRNLENKEQLEGD